MRALADETDVIPCVICGAELYETDTVAVCSFCGRETPAEYLCPNEHHICEECQLAHPLQAVERVCEGTWETDPGLIVNLIMKHPVMVMHSLSVGTLVSILTGASYHKDRERSAERISWWWEPGTR